MINLPERIANSDLFTPEMLALLSSAEKIPDIDPSFDDEHLKSIFQYYALTPGEMEVELHRYAAGLLLQKKIYEAWQVLIST